ncbi:hypothetical protein [Komagataeibacter diospyri]|uniref:hypothetical protein n=1 Tax=Komagataeibacter diospyri TaxID=1932662 RepID=UPI00139679F9|nr:hypothetical protein [Komagataeibacter diospyri]
MNFPSLRDMKVTPPCRPEPRHHYRIIRSRGRPGTRAGRQVAIDAAMDMALPDSCPA